MVTEESIELLSALVLPTPLHIIRKYTGVFRTNPSPITSSVSLKTTVIYLDGNMLYIKHLPETSKNKVAKSRVTKKTATTTTKTKNATKPTPQINAIVSPISFPTSAIFIESNGVPKMRISGATPEETAKNADLQAIAILSPEGSLVSFDIRDGEIMGIRLKREMYFRVAEDIEVLQGNEDWTGEYKRRTKQHWSNIGRK